MTLPVSLAWLGVISALYFVLPWWPWFALFVAFNAVRIFGSK